jgi:hypothetical protein
MLRSLQRHCPEAIVFVLTMDELTEAILHSLALPGVRLLALSAIEDDSLLAVKSDRTIAEYCWTLSSCLTWYVMQNEPEISFITYLDADLLFYSSLQPVFDETYHASIAIIEHRFSSRYLDRLVNGRFCVEWVGFARDEQGLRCLSQWRDQCIDWCYYRLEDGKMGDQKYLDVWPAEFSSCHIIKSAGAGLAPWNYDSHHFSQGADRQVLVDGVPLIFYHFHQFQIHSDSSYSRLSTFYTSYCQEPDDVYAAFESELTEVLSDVRSFYPAFSSGMVPLPVSSAAPFSDKLISKVRGLIFRSVSILLRAIGR